MFSIASSFSLGREVKWRLLACFAVPLGRSVLHVSLFDQIHVPVIFLWCNYLFLDMVLAGSWLFDVYLIENYSHFKSVGRLRKKNMLHGGLFYLSSKLKRMRGKVQSSEWVIFRLTSGFLFFFPVLCLFWKGLWRSGRSILSMRLKRWRMSLGGRSERVCTTLVVGSHLPAGNSALKSGDFDKQWSLLPPVVVKWLLLFFSSCKTRSLCNPNKSQTIYSLWLIFLCLNYANDKCFIAIICAFCILKERRKQLKILFDIQKVKSIHLLLH